MEWRSPQAAPPDEAARSARGRTARVARERRPRRGQRSAPTAVYAGTSEGPSAFPTRNPATAPNTLPNSPTVTLGARPKNAAPTDRPVTAHTKKIGTSKDGCATAAAWCRDAAGGTSSTRTPHEGHVGSPHQERAPHRGLTRGHQGPGNRRLRRCRSDADRVGDARWDAFQTPGSPASPKVRFQPERHCHW